MLPKPQRGVDTDLWGTRAGGRREIGQEEWVGMKRGGRERKNGRVTSRRKVIRKKKKKKGDQLYLEQSPARTADLTIKRVMAILVRTVYMDSLQ